ncbi:MAG: hypothetical protein AAGB26_17015 [Planctomycetota bacterium]
MTDQPKPASDTQGPLTPDALVPGSRVRITKQVAREGMVPTNSVEGTVVKAEQRKTGSWFAHSKDDRLWLDRLEIAKDDGEIYICNVDAHTVIEVIPTEGDTDAA